MNAGAIAFPAAIFAGLAALLAAGWLVLDYPWGVFVFPFLAGVLTCVLCALEIVRAATGRASPIVLAPGSESAAEPLAAGSLAWMYALALFLYGLGFVFGPAAYLFAYLRATRQPWSVTLGIAAASLAVTWGLFIKILAVPLPLMPLWWP